MIRCLIVAVCAVFMAQPVLAEVDGSSLPTAEITRASATLNGVFSPRGYFNLLVPLHTIPGALAAKMDLKQSRITIDFAPGTVVTQSEMRQVMVDAGYRPGPVTLTKLPETQATEVGPGWKKIKHPPVKNGFMRWAEENF